MESEQKLIVETLLRNLIFQTNRVGEVVDEAKWLGVNCRVMVIQVCRLRQILDRLLCMIVTLDPILLLYLNPIHVVISVVSGIIREALELACQCKRKTLFCRLFNGAQTDDFHKLFHLLEACIANMNWLLIIYYPDFSSAFDEIFLSLPQILGYDSSITSAWSCMVAENMIWELLLKSGNVGIFDGSMLRLANLVGEKHGELQFNSLMIIMGITAAAESNLDLRCKAFKTNSPGAKAIVEELLKVIKQSEDPRLRVLAIRSIGSLARIFSERGNHHVIDALVSQLDHGRQEVAMEAIVALTKFACEGNYLRKAHSKRMIESNAVQPLVKLRTDGERTQLQLQGLVLMCNLALNADYSKAMEQARVKSAIQQLVIRKRRRHTVVSQHPEFKELVAKALQNLTLYYKS